MHSEGERWGGHLISDIFVPFEMIVATFFGALGHLVIGVPQAMLQYFLAGPVADEVTSNQYGLFYIDL